MATFQIHEDIENCPNGFKKQKDCDVKQKKEILGKKQFNERIVLQPMDNGTRQDTKRYKITLENQASITENVKKQKDVKSENKEDSDKIERFLKIEEVDEQDVTATENEIEKEYFPLNLLRNDEYGKDIWKYLTDLEVNSSRVKSNYMLKQVDLSWSTRSILIDWLASVTEEYKLCDETFHLTVNYIDRFLSQIAVVRSKFQLVGAAAMFLAGKVEEIYSINAKEWSYLTGDAFTMRQVLKMEQLIIKVLRFRMQPPTIYTFIQHFCCQHSLDTKTMHLALYISELVLLEGDEYLNHLPSELAAASIAFARLTLSKQRPWPKKLKESSGYTLKHLSPVVQRQHKTFKDSPLKNQQAIQTKYKSEKYNRVALLTPRVLILDDLEDEE